jgi:hypothetical protein
MFNNGLKCPNQLLESDGSPVRRASKAPFGKNI